jgi:hypothetical protein
MKYSAIIAVMSFLFFSFLFFSTDILYPAAMNVNPECRSLNVL